MINISATNPTSRYTVRNKSIDGFTITPVLVGGGNLSSSYLDLTQLQLKITLRRNGSETVLANTTLQNLAMMSEFFGPLWSFIFPTVTGVSLLAGPTKAMVPLRIDLGGAINLTGNDELTVEWQLNNTAFFTATNVTAASSFIQLDECETQEIEWITPVMSVSVIEGSQQNVSYNLGENILSVLLLNYDKTTVLDGAAVVNNIQLSSNRVNKNDNYYELLTKQYSYHSTSAEAVTRVQNFCIYSGGDEIDNVKLDLNLVTGNVTSSKNFVLTRSFITDNWLVTRATMLQSQRDATADQKGSFEESLLIGSSRGRN